MHNRGNPALRAALILPDEELRSYVVSRLAETDNVIHSSGAGITVDQLDPVAGGFDVEQLQNYDVLLTGWRTPRLPESLSQLSDRKRYVCHLTGTLRAMIPRSLVQSSNWAVTNWGTSISRFVSEMNLALLLGVSRRFPQTRRIMETGDGWKRELPPGTSLFGKRIGLYGYGFIAREFHKLIEPFGMDVYVFDPYIDAASLTLPIQTVSSLEALFQSSDIISIHAGLTPETESSVDFRLLSMLPEDGIVINTARAGIIEEESLLKAVQETGLRFGLDVFHKEPLSRASPLVSSLQVICTPHSAGVVGNQFARIWATARENLVRFAEGRQLKFVVDELIYERMT
ncbi:MAG: NAD(P)-dependent oxidoreductase [Spirochaetaceae bacterium]